MKGEQPSRILDEKGDVRRMVQEAFKQNAIDTGYRQQLE